MTEYQLVRVRFTPLRGRIRYEIASPLFCKQMNGPIRNRGTYGASDLVWLPVFKTRTAVDRFIAKGVPMEKTMRLATLRYDSCDFALEPATRP